MNKSGESGHLCLVRDLRGNAFHFLSLSMILAVGLLYVEVYSFCAYFVGRIYQKGVLNFVKRFFFASIEMII